MSEEIKEILDNMKEWSVDGVLWFEIDDEKAKILYNYITKLEEENERLNKECDTYMKIATKKQQRINKALEYIEEKYDYILKDATFLDHDELVDRKHMVKLIDILKGDE